MSGVGRALTTLLHGREGRVGGRRKVPVTYYVAEDSSEGTWDLYSQRPEGVYPPW